MSAFTEMGAIAVREDINLEPAFWAQFPGNFKDIAARKALISTANFAGFASGHNFPVGQADGNHWGPAVTLLETTSAGPYHFNFHKGDLGNFTVIGPSGSGKTVVLNFLLAQARKYNPRIVFFDKDRGAEIFLRAIGGRYEVLRPGQPTGFNPLAADRHPGQPRSSWPTGTRLVSRPGETLSADDAGADQGRRRRQLRPAPACAACAISPNCSGAPPSRRRRPGRPPGAVARRGRARLAVRQPTDGLDLDARTLGFDMTQMLDDPTLRTPAMMYLFHRVEQRLDGHPTMIVIDEGWKALDDDVFVARIKDWEKTLRKRNGVVGFATQSAQDALESRIASAIIEQAATQIFMANPKAQARDYCDGFGLTQHEFELVDAARHLALLPDQARDRQRRGPPEPGRRARTADRAVGARTHRPPARRPARTAGRRPQAWMAKLLVKAA
jgi:type IV secretion system protein VirB4